MEITDNGSGAGITASKGRGIENIRQRTKKLGGKVEFSSTKAG